MNSNIKIFLCAVIGLSILFSGCEKEPGTVTDIDGNVYNTVTIGTQVWLKENLRTTKLNDGTEIPNVTSGTEWAGLSTPGYCYYDNSWSNALTYGALYNWHTVNTGKLCPTGWHVPSNEEWITLTNFLGGDTLVGGKLKATGTAFWESPNRGATNETGFSARAGGSRSASGPFLDNVKECAHFWSSTAYSIESAIFFGIYNITSNYLKTYCSKEFGESVRCVRD